jgi:ATP-dependent DNA helicase RecG
MAQVARSTSSTTTLSSDVQYAKHVGPATAPLLRKLGIRTVCDLFYHVPSHYRDLSQIKKVSQVQVGGFETLRLQVHQIQLRKVGFWKTRLDVLAGDETGQILLCWFNAPYMRDRFQPGQRIIVSGKVGLYDRLQIIAPSVEPDVEDRDGLVHAGRIVPIYPLTERLRQSNLRRIIKSALDRYLDQIEEPFKQEHLKRRGLMPLRDAIRTIHYPDSQDQVPQSHRRLAYDEFFLLEMAMALRRRGVKESKEGIAFEVTPEIDARIRARFPFKLTRYQEKALAGIKADLASARPMNRLLQGDVGSGKTVLALYAMLVAVANKWQAALMAPTEVLADQHSRTISRYLEGSRVRIALLSAAVKPKERESVRRALEAGQIDIAIGTHALIEKAVQFARLGVVVIDEQHKFGVLQRARLRHKAHEPDVLVMTATPIPRTLSLTVFGDLDVSTIEGLPPGRQPVQTILVPEQEMQKAFAFIREHVQQGEQAFFIYPLIEESEKLDLKAATERAEFLQRQVFSEFKVGLLHGRMSPADRDETMRAFRDRQYHVLVSTVVIEVGIDIPNATIMVVEHAERFGLSQLHQLRGRIGRGHRKSYCLLFGYPTSEEAQKRLSAVCETSDGFRIAEEDLRIRGPGEFFGTRQHGLPEIKIGDLIGDYEILRTAREDAFALVAADPRLALQENRILRMNLAEKFKDRADLINIG